MKLQLTHQMITAPDEMLRNPAEGVLQLIIDGHAYQEETLIDSCGSLIAAVVPSYPAEVRRTGATIGAEQNGKTSQRSLVVLSSEQHLLLLAGAQVV
ncbi:MAG: hypothetical protein U0105_27540 [Candidatus Obscuribacterales bacterium]